MVKAVTVIVVLVLATAAWLSPANALACAVHGVVSAVPEVMQMDEANIVPSEGDEAYWFAVEIRLEREASAEQGVLLNMSPDERMNASFALAVLAPIVFALLTVGAYAVSRRRS